MKPFTTAVAIRLALLGIAVAKAIPQHQNQPKKVVLKTVSRSASAAATAAKHPNHENQCEQHQHEKQNNLKEDDDEDEDEELDQEGAFTLGWYMGQSPFLSIMIALISVDPETLPFLELTSGVTAMLPWDVALEQSLVSSLSLSSTSQQQGGGDNLLTKLLYDKEWQYHRRDLVWHHFHFGFEPCPDLSKAAAAQTPSFSKPLLTLNHYYQHQYYNGDVVEPPIMYQVERRSIFFNGVSVLAHHCEQSTDSNNNNNNKDDTTSDKTNGNGNGLSLYLLKNVLPRPWLEESVLDVAHAQFRQLVEIAGLTKELHGQTTNTTTTTTTNTMNNSPITLFLPPAYSMDDYDPFSMSPKDLIFFLQCHMVKGRILHHDSSKHNNKNNNNRDKEAGALPSSQKIFVQSECGHTLALDMRQQRQQDSNTNKDIASSSSLVATTAPIITITVNGVRAVGKPRLARNGIVYFMETLLPRPHTQKKVVPDILVMVPKVTLVSSASATVEDHDSNKNNNNIHTNKNNNNKNHIWNDNEFCNRTTLLPAAVGAF